MVVTKQFYEGTIPWHLHNARCAKKRLRKELRLPERQRNNQLIKRLESSIQTSVEIIEWFSKL